MTLPHPKFDIRICELSEIERYSAHCIQHLKEKGINGIYAHPFPSSHPWNVEEFAAKLTKSWSLTTLSPNWEIAWVVIADHQFVGHLNLRCGPIEASKHRMKLGMGILTPYRSNGIGKALMATAIDWCTSQTGIAWIDLNVFAHNFAARKLYKSFGFEEQFTVQDALRINDETIDDIQMTLKL